MTRPLSVLARLAFILAAAYCLTLFIALFVRAEESSQREFFWPIQTPTSSFLGAWFGASALTLVLAAISRTWDGARGLVAGLAVSALALLYAPFAREDDFRLDHFVMARVWYAGLAGGLILFALIALYQELLVLARRAEAPMTSLWLRRLMLLAAFMLWFLGLVLTVAPGVLQPRWAWACFTPDPCLNVLPERDMVAIGAVLLGAGLTLGWCATDGRAAAIRIGGLVALAGSALALWGSVRFFDYLEEDRWATVGLFGVELALFGLGGAALILTRRWKDWGPNEQVRKQS